MFDFSKFNQVGDYLSLICKEEYNRSAISRYYYSLFCCARLYLILIMGETDFESGINVHGRVCERLRQSSDDAESVVGETLEELRQLRNLADYDWFKKDSSFFKDRVIFAKKESKDALEQLQALGNSPPFEL